MADSAAPRDVLTALDRLVPLHQDFWSNLPRTPALRAFRMQRWNPWYASWATTRPLLDSPTGIQMLWNRITRRRTPLEVAPGTARLSAPPAPEALASQIAHEAYQGLMALRAEAEAAQIPTPVLDLGAADLAPRALPGTAVAGGDCGAKMYYAVTPDRMQRILDKLVAEGASVTGQNPWHVDTGRHGVELRGTWYPQAQQLLVEVTDTGFLVPCGAVWDELDALLRAIGASLAPALVLPPVSGFVDPLSGYPSDPRARPPVDLDQVRRDAVPRAFALIQTAIREVNDGSAAAGYVWILAPDGTTQVTPFPTYAQALDYARESVGTPHVALASFDRSSPHWPNPVTWHKARDPDREVEYEAVITDVISRPQPARKFPPQVSG